MTREAAKLDRPLANQIAVLRMAECDPSLVAVGPAGSVVPGMHSHCIATSGPPLRWDGYSGGQRSALQYAAVYEGLADSPLDAGKRIGRSELEIKPCSELGMVGSVSGVCTASMPVLVVEDAGSGFRSFCTLYEGPFTDRLNYGAYNENVQKRLNLLKDIIGPQLHIALRQRGSGIRLRPIIAQALRMGDELHSCNTAASVLFAQEIAPTIIEANSYAASRKTLEALTADNYFFLRLSMAASKLACDLGRDVAGSSVVTAMCFNCRQFGIQISGLPGKWFCGPHGDMTTELQHGYSAHDIDWIGGESTLTETSGLGAFAQAASPTLAKFHGGSYSRMLENNRKLYGITTTEHPVYRIPSLDGRGVPLGIDVQKVQETGITPTMHVGVPGRLGGQIGAGVLQADEAIFSSALRELDKIGAGQTSDPSCG